jgi:hypothetical protein
VARTAYSQSFGRELDFKQLLTLRKITGSVDEVDYGLSSGDREWMRKDLLCPSCRCGGASLVRSDVGDSGRNTREAHFRFIDASGHTAHKLGCDFFRMDDAPGVQRGVDVQFSANDKDTRLIRGLVCKAIAAGELSKTSIFDMRSWFLAQRDRETFRVKGTPAMVDWLWHVHRLFGYEAFEFQPFHVGLPGFDPRRAARRDLAFRHRDIKERIPRVSFDAAVRDKAKQIVQVKPGELLIAMESLRLKFETTCRLADVMVIYGALQLTKRKSVGSIYGDAPQALLAFTALLLFVSDWDENAALARFARILVAPEPDDQTLGNVIGLNPFHDFAALEIVRFVAGMTPDPDYIYDYEAELAGVLAKIDRARV